MRAAIYARVSTEEQASNYSISVQLEAARNLAQARGYEVAGEYVDEGWSGAVLERPAFSRLLGDCRAGLVDVIVVYRIDRFFRDVRHLLDTMDFLEGLGVKFVSATEPFDTSTPVGRYLLGQFGLIAELERNTFMERSKAGRLKRMAGGKWWGPAPFGYTYDPATGTLEIDEREAEVIRLAFRLYQQPGRTVESVAGELNACGHRTRKGYKWSGATVHGLLTRELYTGRSHFRSAGKEAVPISAPQIIDREEFELVRSLLEQRRLLRDPKKRVRMFLLRHLARCGECGGMMGPGYGDRDGEGYKYYYYTCYNSRHRRGLYRGADTPGCRLAWVKAEDLEALVWRLVAGLIVDPERVRAALEAMAAEPAGSEEGAAAAFQKRLEEVRRQRDALLRSFRDGLLPEGDLRRLLKEIAEEEKVLLEKVRQAAAAGGDARAHLSFFGAFHRDYCGVVENLSDEERREIVLALVKEVLVHADGTVEVVFNAPRGAGSGLVMTACLGPPHRRPGLVKRGRKRSREYFYVKFPCAAWERMRRAASEMGEPVTAFIMLAVREWLEAGGAVPGAEAYLRQRLEPGGAVRATAALDRETIRLLRQRSKETGVNISTMIRAAVLRRLDRLQAEGVKARES